MGAVEGTQLHKVLRIPGIQLGCAKKRLLGTLLPFVIRVPDEGLAQKKMVAGVGIVPPQRLFAVLDGVVAYDFPVSDIIRNTSGSHEFMVNYCFDISLGKSPSRYKSIRFL